MKIVRLAVVGFGNVSQGMAQILRDRGDFLARQYGIEFRIVAVSDFKLGSLMNVSGLPVDDLLKAADKLDLTTVPAETYEMSVEAMIQQANSDTLVETSYTNLETGEPALSYIRSAMKKGMHVVTTNKGPISLKLPELRALADENHVKILYEGTVMSGTPALALAGTSLAAAGITSIRGILNGTTNYILTQMEAGLDYTSALAEAQSLGYAEADPTGDVEGYDTAGKVVILSNLLMETNLTMRDIDCEGITNLTPEDIRQAQSKGMRWKLIGEVEKSDGQVVASVRPTRISVDHSLASVSGPVNAVTVTTESLGDVTLVGPGAGRVETGYALIHDLLAVHRDP